MLYQEGRSFRMNSPDPNPETEPPAYASTEVVASALGVGVSTVKRWVDEGILPAHRTPGGHRKLLVRDVLRLARSGELPHADLTVLFPEHRPDGVPLAPLRKKLRAAVDAADSDAIRDVLLEGYRGGLPMEAIADSLIAPALRRVGRCWERGTMSMLAEHRITLAFVAALHRWDPVPASERSRPVAVGGAAEGDHSVLPTLLAKMTLLDAGWDAIDLGPHTPISEFVRALDIDEPKLVWLSASHISDPERFAQEYGEFYRLAESRGIAVLIGGSAVTGEMTERLPSTTRGGGFVQLAAFAKSLHAPPALPVRGRPTGGGKKAT